MTPDETNKLTQAFKNAIEKKTKGKKLEDIANYHGAPYNICDEPGCCPHYPYLDFMIWHRLYMGMSNMIHNTVELGDKELFGHPKIVP